MRPRQSQNSADGEGKTLTRKLSETEGQPQLLAIKYGTEAEGAKDPYQYDRKPVNMITDSESSIGGLKEEDEFTTARSSESSLDDMPHLIPAEQSKPTGLKRVVSLLHRRSPRFKSTSPRFESPTALKRTLTPSPEIFASPPSTPTTSQSPPRPRSVASSIYSVPDSEARPYIPFSATTSNLSAINLSYTSEEEDNDTFATKQQINAFTLSDAAAAPYALQLTHSRLETDLITIDSPYTQAHLFAHTEHPLLSATTQTHIAEENVRSMKTANHFFDLPNPHFTSTHLNGLDDETIRTREYVLASRAALRRQRWEEALRKRVTVRTEVEAADGTRKWVEKARYLFEADEDE